MNASGHTGYPPIGRFPHLAPAMGSVPIFGVRGLRAAEDPATSATERALAPAATGEAPPAVESELFVGTGTAALSGAIIGGTAAGSWRGAGIGAGVSVGLWAGFTVTGHWAELSLRGRSILIGGLGVGLLGAALLSYTEKK